MLIKRKEYLNKLIALKDKKIIKIITGVRRCGKSTLMNIFKDYLLQNGVNSENIISINFEDYDFYDLREPDKLYPYIKERLDSEMQNYIFLDEIQHVKDFPRIVDSLFIKNNVDIYITGSNAYMLSSELATLISGRYIEISMLPLSFAEYVSTTGDKRDLSRKYLDYIRNSSFPYTLELRAQSTEIQAYLEGIYNTAVVKDIATRKKIVDVSMLESVIRFMFDNIGNITSATKIANTLTSAGYSASVHTVNSYLSALCESFVLYRAGRYDVKGKQYLKAGEKFYIADIGLRYYLLGSKPADQGHILENVVYLELLRRGCEVYVGKTDSAEIDFIASDSEKTEYYQVALTVRDPNTLERELAPLNAVPDHNPKYLLTLDDDPPCSHNGIRQINALDWLLE